MQVEPRAASDPFVKELKRFEGLTLGVNAKSLGVTKFGINSLKHHPAEKQKLGPKGSEPPNQGLLWVSFWKHTGTCK